MPDFISTLLSAPANTAGPRSRGSQTNAWLALGMAGFLWGTAWLAAKQGLYYLPAFQMAGMRQFLAGLAYTVYLLLRGPLRWPGFREWKTICILAFFNFILGNGLAVWGLSYISGGLAAILATTVPLWLVINHFFVNSPAPSLRAIIGFSMGIAGLCFIFYDHLHSFPQPAFILGIVLSLGAAWACATGAWYTKKQAQKINPFFGIGLQMMISGMVLYVVSKLGGVALPLAKIAWQGWAAIAYLVILGAIMPFIAYLYALQNLHALQRSLYPYISAGAAVLLGAFLFNEKFSRLMAVGAFICLYGGWLVNRAYRKIK